MSSIDRVFRVEMLLAKSHDKQRQHGIECMKADVKEVIRVFGRLKV